MHSAEYYEDIKMRFPSILAECGGIVSTAVKKAGINQDTFYTWRNKDPLFRKQVDAVRDKVDDFYETEFIKLVKDGNPSAIIYAAKTRLRHRGYGGEVTINYGDIINMNNANNEELSSDEQGVIERYVQQRINQYESKKAVALLENTNPTEDKSEATN